MKNEVVFMNEYDDVIFNYKGNDFEELVGMISEDDVVEMANWLEDECGYIYDFLDMPYKNGTYRTEKEKCEYIIADYIKEWLCMQIRNNIITGTKELFRLVSEVM